jgi:hypothetical protein
MLVGVTMYPEQCRVTSMVTLSQLSQSRSFALHSIRHTAATPTPRMLMHAWNCLLHSSVIVLSHTTTEKQLAELRRWMVQNPVGAMHACMQTIWV